jgi:hypothetical protein
MLGSGFHPHVWYAASGDIFRRNIVSREYRPALMPAPPWGQELDHNLLHQPDATSTPATRLQQQSGRDQNSLVADAQFIDPAHGDYRVKPGSPALALGFVNFPMDQFGVRKPALRALARTPELPSIVAPASSATARDTTPRAWLGATVRTLADFGEVSALGLASVEGALILDVSSTSPLAKARLQKGDVILTVNGTKVTDATNLIRNDPTLLHGQALHLTFSRQQKELTATLTP